jgi:hypothetical protein
MQHNSGKRIRVDGGLCARSGVDSKLLEKLVAGKPYREVPSDVFGRLPDEGRSLFLVCRRQVVYQLQEATSSFVALSSIFEPLNRVVDVPRQRMVFQERFHKLCVWRWAWLRLGESAVLVAEDELIESEIARSLPFNGCRHG